MAAYYRGDLDGAIEMFERLLEAPDFHPQQRLVILAGDIGLFLAYMEAGRLNDAQKTFDRILQDHTGSRDAASGFGFRKAQNFLWLGLPDQAVRSARQAVEENVPFAEFNLYMIQTLALADLDSLNAARVSFERGTSAGAFSECYRRASMSLVSARILVAEGNAEMAINSLEESRHLLPAGEWSISHQGLMSRAQRLAGRPAEAARTLHDLLRVYGGHALAHFELGQIYEEMREPESARAEYETFLKMWHRADETLPQLGEARRRLGALRSRPG